MRLYFVENVSFGFTNLNTLKISFWCFSVNLFVLYVVALNVALKQDSMLSYLNRQLSPPCSESTSTTEFLVSHIMWFDWLILLVCNVVWNRKIKCIIKHKLFWTIDVLLMMNHRCTDYALVFSFSNYHPGRDVLFQFLGAIQSVYCHLALPGPWHCPGLNPFYSTIAQRFCEHPNNILCFLRIMFIILIGCKSKLMYILGLYKHTIIYVNSQRWGEILLCGRYLKRRYKSYILDKNSPQVLINLSDFQTCPLLSL